MSGIAGPGDHLVAFVAHPDDESFGCGSVLADAVARGARVSVSCASLGEQGELAEGYELGGRMLAEVRHDELRAAAVRLGAGCLEPLGLPDSGWDGPAPAGSICALPTADVVARVGAVLDDLRPDVVLTLAGDNGGPPGSRGVAAGGGHRDHRRLTEALGQAVAARPGPRFYHWCLPNELMQRWAEQMTRLRPDTAHLALEVAGLGTPPERITDVLDTGAQLATRRAAIAAHASQTSPYEGLPDDLAEAFLSRDHLIRVA